MGPQLHIAKNFLVDQGAFGANSRVPLILGIWGGKGQVTSLPKTTKLNLSVVSVELQELENEARVSHGGVHVHVLWLQRAASRSLAAELRSLGWLASDYFQTLCSACCMLCTGYGIWGIEYWSVRQGARHSCSADA